MLRVNLVDRFDDLSGLQLTWKHLWQETRQANFFQTLDWLRLYWSHFGNGQRLKVLVVERNGNVIGLVPLVVRTELTRIGSVRVLTYPLHDWGTFFGPLGAEPTAVLSACFQWLAQQKRDWDLLDLRWINRSEVDRERTPTALSVAGFSTTPRIWRTTAVVDLGGSWNQYLSSRTSKFRNNLRRAEVGADRAGQLSFERYRPAGIARGENDVQWQLFEECLTLAERSWQGRSTTGTTLSHPDVRDFFRDLFGLAAECGALDLNLLRLDNRLVAFTYNLISHGSVTGLRLGYDPDEAVWSPGRLVLARSISDSFRRGDERIDLGSESMAFKREWLTQTVDAWRYTHYPISSLRGQLLRLKHSLQPAPSYLAAVEC